METARTPWYSRALAAVAAAIAAVAASIVLPSAVITVQAFRLRDADEIEHFAVGVAEPLGLLGAATATFLLARWASRRSPGGRELVPWVGVGAAAGLIGAAVWVLDADWWTVAGGVLMPLLALAGGAVGARRWRGMGPAELAPPPPDLSRPRREAESTRRQ